MTKKFLIIDSGIGGLSTLATIKLHMPNLNAIYYADDKFFPYGEKTKGELISHIVEIVETFETQISGLILACNTATGVAVEILRKLFCFPIIGIEPAILPAIKTGKPTMVLVTPLEAKANKYLELARNKKILTYSTPILANEIENQLMLNGCFDNLSNSGVLINELNFINELASQNNISNIVLGCTHYVFLRTINAFKDFKLFDGNDGVSKRIDAVFGNVFNKGSIQILFASGDEKKSQIALRLFKNYCEFLSNLRL